jgi:hypothetical protein
MPEPLIIDLTVGSNLTASLDKTQRLIEKIAELQEGISAFSTNSSSGLAESINKMTNAFKAAQTQFDPLRESQAKLIEEKAKVFTARAQAVQEASLRQQSKFNKNISDYSSFDGREGLGKREAGRSMQERNEDKIQVINHAIDDFFSNISSQANEIKENEKAMKSLRRETEASSRKYKTEKGGSPLLKSIMDLVGTTRIGIGRFHPLINRLGSVGGNALNEIMGTGSINKIGNTVAKLVGTRPKIEPPPVHGAPSPPPYSDFDGLGAALAPLAEAISPFILPIVAIIDALTAFAITVKFAVEAVQKATSAFFSIAGAATAGAVAQSELTGLSAKQLAGGTHGNAIAAMYGINPVYNAFGDIDDAKRTKQAIAAIRGAGSLENAKRVSIGLTGSPDAAKAYLYDDKTTHNTQGLAGISPQMMGDVAQAMQNFKNIMDAVTTGISRAFAPVFKAAANMDVSFDLVANATQVLFEGLFGSLIMAAKIFDELNRAITEMQLAVGLATKAIINMFGGGSGGPSDQELSDIKDRLDHWDDKSADRTTGKLSDISDNTAEANRILGDMNHAIRGAGERGNKALPNKITGIGRNGNDSQSLHNQAYQQKLGWGVI